MSVGQLHPLRSIAARLAAAALLLLASMHADVSHAQTDSTTVSTTSGTVLMQAAGSDGLNQLSTDAQAVAWGDVIQVNEVGEAALNYGDALKVRIFHRSQAQVLGSTPPADPAVGDNDPAVQALGDGAYSVYELLHGATYNTASADTDVGSPVVVSTPGASVASMSGAFLLYYDPGSATTWVSVTDGTATPTRATISTRLTPARMARQ